MNHNHQASINYKWVQCLDDTLSFCLDCCNIINSNQNPAICKCGRRNYYCFECSCYQPESIMYNCTLCGGRKCFNHGGENRPDCKSCKSTGLCWDCYARGSYCTKLSYIIPEMKYNIYL